MAGLYVPIRGDYTEFQKDIKRLQGIARTSAQELSDIFSNAFSKGDASRGLSQIGMALKKLGAAANTVGAQFKPAIAEISEFAQKCGVSANQVERLVTQMGYAARERQMISSLRTLQRQAGLTDSALAQLARHRNLFAESGSIASEGLGVRTAAKIKADIREAEAAFKQFQMTANLTGESTQRQFEAMTAKVRQFSMELMNASQKEAFLRRERYDSLVAQAGQGRTSYAQFEAREKARNAVNAFQEMNGRLPRPKEIREIAAATGIAANQIRKMRDELDHSSNAFKALIGYAQVWLTFGFAHTAIDFVKTAMALENVKVAFQAIYGTSDMAQAKLDYVRQVSEQLGLSFLDTAEGAKKLFAAAAGTPVEKEANMVFKAFSDMSAAMKLTGDETKGVFLALSQMISKGKVSAEELRQQLAERMPGAVNLFARSIGKTTQELDKMLQKGEVTLEHFLMFSREVQNTYGAGAIAAGGSLQAELNRLKNAWVDFKASMTDTDTLASGVRTLTAMFKTLSPAIEFVSKHVKTLAAVSLAGWIGSSLAPGGKLRGVLSSIGDAAGKARERVQAFNEGQRAMVIRATGASAAVGKLRAALSGLGSGALYGVLFAIAGGLLEIAHNAAKASRGFQNAAKSMSEYVSDMAKSQEAMEKSNFTPSMQRKMLLGDVANKRESFAGEYEKNSRAIEYASNEFFGDTGFYDAGVAHKKAGELWKAFNKAIDEGNVDAAKNFQQEAIAVWESGMGNIVKRIGGNLGEDLNNEWGEMMTMMGSMLASTEKYLQTFSSESSDAAKRLGFNSAQMQEDLKKLNEAAAKTDLGKAFSGVQNMEKLKEALGDTSLAYTENAKAILDSGDKLQAYLNQLQKGADNYKQHQADFDSMAQQVIKTNNISAGSFKELEAAQAGLEGEQKELSKQSEGLAMYITNCALAAGGSETAFRMMESLVRSMAPLFEQLGISIETVIGKIRDFQIAAANAVYETAALSGAQAAEMSVWNAKVAAAVKKGDKKAYRAAKEGAVRADAENKGLAYPKITPEMEANWDREYGFKRDLITINESGKKGGRGKGGGGSKRVDNTAEKYDSAYEGFRKEIAKLQGEVDKVTLDKKFADMDKALKGSKHNIKELKTEYFEAFNANKVQELRKEIMQLTGDEQALADLEMAEKMKAFNAEMEGVAKAAKDLGREVPDDLNKFKDAYAKALETNNREQELQRLVSLAGDLLLPEEQRKQVYEAQNELIEIQYEKMKKISPEIAEIDRRMKELEARVKNNDPFAGMQLGFERWRKSAGNMAENLADTVENAFKGMEDAFVNFVQTGKLNFTDLANSIIADLVRMSVRASMSGLWDLIGQGINVLAGAFSSSAVTGKGMSFAGSGASESASLGLMRHGHALGDVFTGLQGFSNQIVSRPTLFSYGSQLTRFAKGGVMGEAGPEAVMPLTRTASGHLGVRSDGYGQAPVVVNIVNNTGQEARQETKMDGDGTRSIEVTVGDMAASQMLKSGSTLNKAVRTFTGQSQQVVRR